MNKLKNKIFVTLICSLFVGNSFVFPQQTSTVSDTVPMSGINSPSAGRLQIDHEASSLSSALNPYNISIPEQFGQIEEVFQGAANSPLVVHVQNVHANYEAQVNIKNILNHLVDQYQFSLIQLEGAVSKLDPAILQPSYLKEANLKLVDFLMREGRITGADAYAVETDKPVELYGIEDYSLYMENLKMFKAIYKHQEDLKPYFDEVHRLILSVGPKLLKPEQLDFTRKTEEFSTDKIDLMDYLVYMNKLSEKNKILSLNEMTEMVDYPNLTRLMRLQKLEEELNKAGLKKETEAIKVEFQKKMPNSEKVNELLSHLDESAKGTNPRDYFLELTKLADEAKIDFIPYPAFCIFAEFLIHQDEIDHRALFSELKEFEHMLQEKLFTTEDEQLYLSIIDKVGLLEQFFRLEMSREKIALYLKDRETAKPSWVFARLEELAQKNGVTVKTTPDVQKLDSYMSEVEYFYQLVLERDKVFTDKILTKTKSLSLDKTIVVTGGFHKDGLVDYFRKEKISYVVINPKVDVKEGNQNYLKVMLEDDAVAGSVFAGTFALEENHLGNPGSSFRTTLYSLAPGVGPATVFVAPRQFDRGQANKRAWDIRNQTGVIFEVKSNTKQGFTSEQISEAQFYNMTGQAERAELRSTVNEQGVFSVEVAKRSLVSDNELKRAGIFPNNLNVTPIGQLPGLMSLLDRTGTFQTVKPSKVVGPLNTLPLRFYVADGLLVRDDRQLAEELGSLSVAQALQVYSLIQDGRSLAEALVNVSGSRVRPITADDIQRQPFDEIRKARLQFFDSIQNPGRPGVLLLAVSENTAMAQLSFLAKAVEDKGTAAVVYGKGVSKLVDAMGLRAELRAKIKTIDVPQTASERVMFGRMFEDLTTARHTYGMYRKYVAPYTNEPLATAPQFLERGYVRALVPEENPVISPRHPLLPKEVGLRDAIAQLFPNLPQFASAIRRPKVVQSGISNDIPGIEFEVLRRIPRNNADEVQAFQTLLRKYALFNIVVGQGVQWGFASGIEGLLSQISLDMQATVREAVSA